MNPFSLMNKKLLLTLLTGVLVLPTTGFAQFAKKDSLIPVSIFSASYTFQVPGADMAKRFGYNSCFGGSYIRKNAKNMVWGFDANYYFGDQLKDKEILDSISTSGTRQILNKDGSFSDVRLYERGFSAFGKVGKVFPVIGYNRNSGLLITAGAGFMQHHIRIETISNDIPQLDKDYKKGYDRLSNGFALNQFIGYWHMSNNRRFNFYLGADLTQAFTQSRRSYDFFTQQKDTQKRTDLLYGVKFGIMFPVYKRQPKEFYFN